MPAVCPARWPIALTSYRVAKPEWPLRRSNALSRAISDLSYGPLFSLGSDCNAPIAPQLEHIVGQAHQAPFPAELLHAAQQKSPETTDLFDLTKYGFHDDLAPGVQRLPCRRPYFRRHALLCRGGWSARLSPRAMMPLASRRHVRIEPSVLQGLCRYLTVIALVQGRRESLDRARLVL